jgi:hypothetical protein
VVLAAGVPVPVPASLREGWRGAPPVAIRTLQQAFRCELTAAEAAAWAEGEAGQRAAGVYLTRPAGHRNEVWEMDHKQLPAGLDPHTPGPSGRARPGGPVSDHNGPGLAGFRAARPRAPGRVPGPGPGRAPTANAALREPETRVRGRTPATGLVAASAGHRRGDVSSMAAGTVARVRISPPLTIRRAALTLSMRFR